MNTRSSTWSVVLAFGDPRRVAPGGVSARDYFVAACLDTLDAVTEAVEPSHVSVISDLAPVVEAARACGATALPPGRDMTTDVNAAMAQWAASAPQRSGVALVGPLPYATADTVFDALRACAATESAVIVADDGGSVALSHHDPARLAPRFGGASAARHTRGSVAVGQHVDGLQRTLQAGRAFPGRHLRSLTDLHRDSTSESDSTGAAATTSHATATTE